MNRMSPTKQLINQEEDELSSHSIEDNQNINDTTHNEDIDEFNAAEISICKSLLLLAPTPSCKEARRLLNGVKCNSLIYTFDKILDLTKTTNKELIHYLSTIRKFPHKKLNLQKLTDFKFFSQDKYLNQVIFLYFSIINHYYDFFTYEQKLSIFYRYIYLFSSHISMEFAIYELFKKFLKKDFLIIFVSNNYYKDFYFLKDFLFDFSAELEDYLFKIGYELLYLREYLFYLSNTHYKNWVLQRWDIHYEYAISNLFYNFDCVYFLDDVANKKFNILENPYKNLKNELTQSNGTSNICCQIRDTYNIMRNKKREIRNSIANFNKTKNLMEPLNIENIRLFPDVDLKMLGEYLGKEHNYNNLIRFAKTFNFQSLDVFQAIRLFLTGFILPGESQVIERAVKAFTYVYVSQNTKLYANDQYNESLLLEMYSKAAYGIIALNTMLHNPNIDKKPSFEEYSKFVDYSEYVNIKKLPCGPLDLNAFKVYYENIKENELKFSSFWIDSFDKYQLARNVSDEFYITFLQNDKFKFNNFYCEKCIKFAYKNLFEKSLVSFLNLNCKDFFEMCRILDFPEGLEFFIISHKNDLSKLLESCKLYFENFIGNQEIATIFIECLSKTEKQKYNVFGDWKSIFSKSTTDLREKTPQSNVLNLINSIRFANENICTENCKLLSEILKEEKKQYAQQIINNIFINNSDLLNNFDGLDDNVIVKIFDQNPEKNMQSERFPDFIRIKYFKSKFKEDGISEEDYKMFSQIKLYNQDSFDAYCLAQLDFDQFDKIVKIRKIPLINTDNKNNKIAYEIEEKYAECMKDVKNILTFFKTCPYIINLRIARNIHKEKCPLEMPIFNDPSKIAYCIFKCNNTDQQLFMYMSYLINYLSDSLVLLTDILLEIYPILFQINEASLEVIMKILAKRIKNYCHNEVICCEKIQKSNESAKYLSKLRILIKKLINDKFLQPSDIKAFIERGIVRSESIEI